MSTQTISLAKPAYAYTGYLNIRRLLYQRKLLCTSVLSEYFPDLATTWSATWNDELKPILFAFGNSSMVNIAMPDKPDTQGDGSLTPWKINKTMGTMSAMYRMLVSAGVTLNTSAPLEISTAMSMEDPKEAGIRRDRWDSILDTAEKIHEIESTISMILLSVYPCKYASGDITRSPGQMLTIGGDMAMTPALISPAGGSPALDFAFTYGEFSSGIYDLPYDKLLLEDVSDVSAGMETITTGTLSIAEGTTYTLDLSSIPYTFVSVPYIIITDTRDNSNHINSPKNAYIANQVYAENSNLYLPQTALTSLGCGSVYPLLVTVKVYVAVEY